MCIRDSVNNEPPPLPITVTAPARELIEIGLRKDPGQRFRDGNEMQLAVRQVREGTRPAQPGGRTQVIAAEPSPTASTQMLADVTENRTSRPTGAYPPSAARAIAAKRPPQPAPARAPQPPPAGQGGVDKQKPSKAWPIAAALLALALLGGGGAWAWSSGAFDGLRKPAAPTPTSAPTLPTVTQTETVSEEPETETVIRETVRERPTVTQREPGTITFEPETEASAPPAASTRTSAPAAPTTATQREQPSAAQPGGASGHAGQGQGEVDSTDVSAAPGGDT